MTRLAGADRWSTAHQVGSHARTLGGGTASDPPSPDASLSVPSDVREPEVHLSGAERWVATDCAGDVPIVVGSDAAAQSDIYSAVTLAGVVGTDCVILAGPRDGTIATSQQARLDAAAVGGFVVGGTAAVPTAKIAGRDMTRLAGADRWDTAQLVGRRASGDTTAGTSTLDEAVAAEEPEESESSVEWVFEIKVKPSWAAELAELERFAHDCGYYTGIVECDNPEDTQALEQMYDDFMGDECDADLSEPWGCRGMTRLEQIPLMALRACPAGWSMASGEWCFHPTHLDYSRRKAYHDPSEADPRGYAAIIGKQIPRVDPKGGCNSCRQVR